MPKLFHFFMFFLVCNATHALICMNGSNLWNDHSDAAQRYEEEKELTRKKIERHKKHPKPTSKKSIPKIE